MKRFILFFTLLLACAALTAETVRLGAAGNFVNVLSSTDNETVLEFGISSFEKTAVQIAGATWYNVTLPGEGITQDAGFPQLPVFNRSVAIPAQALMRIQILDAQYKDIELPIAPSKGIITRDQNPDSIPYTFGDIYKSKGFYPARIAELSEPYILRDVRGLTILTSPFAYDPSSRVLRVFTSYKVRIFADGLDSRNVLVQTRPTVSRAFAPIYENHFLNWQNQRYTAVDDSYGKLLVICPASFVSAVQPYVNWKIQKGIPTELIEWSTIGTTAAQLQTYIQNRYNADPEITYVQIVGDAPQIPSLSSGGGGSDPSFSLVAGSDNYPDIFIGRFSAETAAQVTAQINKAIIYERDLTTGATWLSRALGIASAEGGGSLGDNGESDIAHMNLIRTDLLNYGYTTVDQVYDPGASASTVTTNINAGRGFVNYVGHGSDTSWGTTGFSNTNASALTNGNMTPIIQDVACVNGNFVSLTCFAEAWLRNANGGAVAMYASSINQSWNSPMRAQDETTDLLIAGSKFTAGGLFYNGSCKMMDVYGNTSGSDGVNMFKTWHIFGDASLLVRSKTPLAMTVTHPSQIVMGNTTMAVSTGVANALVALTYHNVIYGRGFTNSSGNVTLNLTNPPTGVLTYTLTVTALNRVTYVASVQQITPSGPWLNATAAYTDPEGSLPEYGESGYFDVTFQNVGSGSASNVTAVLSCATTGITITDAAETIASLAAGASTTVPGAFSIMIADNIANGTVANFTVAMSSGRETWNSNFTLTINSPELAFGSLVISDSSGDHDGRLDPGETVLMTLPLQNTGGAESPAGTANLACATPGITVNTPSVSINPVAASGSANLVFSVTASSGVANGTLATIIVDAAAGAFTANYEGQTTIGSPAMVILGSGTSATGTTTACPINIYYDSLHGQSVYTAAELNAAGVYGPLTISQMGFYVNSVPSLPLPSFVIRMKHTTSTNVASWITATGMTTVYSATSYTPTAGGYDMLTLSTPFTWNGTDNIVIDTAFSPVTTWSSSGTTQYTSVTNGYRYVRADDVDQTNVFTGGSTSTNRPNVKLALYTVQNGPSIAANPSSVTATAYSGESTQATLTVYNTGNQTLTWSTAASFATWGSVSPTSGSIAAGANTILTLTLNSAGLALGTYNSSLVLASNAINYPSLSVPVSLTVVENPYPVNPRFVAEWEPAQGALVRYPLGLPYSLLVALSNNGLLYVVVSSSSQSACNSSLSSNGVNMANVRYINATTDTYWIRDYGPWTIFNGDNEMQIVDFDYNRPRPNDDIIPVTVANYLGIDYYHMDLTATGGNVMCDGHEAAMSTQLILEENSSLTQAQIDALAENYLGVTDYQFYVDPNNTYIDHIDCWGKLLDVDKVLIRSVPTSHAQYDEIEAVVDDWESRTSGYGTPYQIFRVYTPNNEPYTNSYIMNKRIFVPLMGTANDAAAIAAYQAAMPGYTVTGYTHTTWESTDALHCRVNTVFDAQMVHGWHVPPTSATANSNLAINVHITHANPLNAASTYVAYRHSASGVWQYAPLSNVSGNDWTATVPTPALGQTVYYYILATDTTARNATLPLCGALDPFEVVVDIPAGNNPPTITLPASFSFAMNGSLAIDFSSFVDDADDDDLTLSCSGNSNVFAAIEGLNVTFSATADWYGTESLVFTVSDGTDAASDTVSVIVNLTYLAEPVAAVSCSAGNVNVSWPAVPNAVSYEVWACDDPYGTYSLQGRTADLYWTELVSAEARRFYKVLATDIPLTSK